MRMLIVLSAAAALLITSAAGATGSATPRRGPSGDTFYAPPAKLVRGKPGTVIWQRPATGLPRLKAARSTTTIVYRSRSLQGKPIAESATVALPPGTPPKNGWPIVSFFHVTTGSADNCAPSRATKENTEVERMTRADAVVSHMLKAGVAVVRPDGEGIGTPGPHPYLIGRSLARTQADAAHAARAFDRRIGTRWGAAGHSEGGVAALWTAAYAKRFAPDLDLRAAIAFSPVTRVREQVDLLRNEPIAGPGADGLSALASLIITGAGVADPKLGAGLVQGALSEEATMLLPDVEKRCLNDLGKHDSWGALAPADIPGPRFDEFRDAFYAVLDASDPRRADLGKVPVRVDAGGSDAVAPLPFTQLMVDEQHDRGADLTFKVWPTATHVDITSDAQAGPEAAGWLVARLAR